MQRWLKKEQVNELKDTVLSATLVVGGAAQVLAEAVRRVERVFMLEEFGVPEALWVLHVERFPVMVTMDSHGNSLHDEVESRSRAELGRLLEAPSVQV